MAQNTSMAVLRGEREREREREGGEGGEGGRERES